MIEQLQNHADEIEFWEIEPEDTIELEESDILGVYINDIVILL